MFWVDSGFSGAVCVTCGPQYRGLSVPLSAVLSVSLVHIFCVFCFVTYGSFCLVGSVSVSVCVTHRLAVTLSNM